MKHVLAVALGFALTGCGLLGGGGGGGGGGSGGGGGAFEFSKGFVYVRKDDRNVYLTDESDFQTSVVLTAGGGASSPSLSPDGKRAVFVQKIGTDTQLATVPTAGGMTSVLLAADAQHKNFRQPTFSPDGKQVAFAYDEGMSPSIGLIASDGSAAPVKLVGGGSLSYALPSFTSDGRGLLVAAGTTGADLTQIERLDTSTGLPTPITNTLGNEVLAITNRLMLSANGKQAVFDGRVSSGVSRIFVIDLTTKVVTKVNEYMNEPGTNDTFPCWVDGSTVAYSSDSGGNDNVYYVSTTGASRRLKVAKAIEAFYSPAGQ